MEDQKIETPELTPSGLEQALAECKQRYAYLQADFDNYRKRIESQRVQWSQSAQLEVLLPLLDIIDDFDRAQHDIKNPAFELIYKAFKKLVAKFNITGKIKTLLVIYLTVIAILICLGILFVSLTTKRVCLFLRSKIVSKSLTWGFVGGKINKNEKQKIRQTRKAC